MKIKKVIWEIESWLPGVLSKRQLNDLITDEFLLNTDHGKALGGSSDHSSLDLHLTDEGYEMINGSIKPCGGEYKVFYGNKELATRIYADENGEFKLQQNRTYVFRIRESFSPLAKNSTIFAQATAKSSIGRLDVVARLIVDGMHAYEYMNPVYITSGNMFLEITPITFNIKVKKGSSLSQIRFFIGDPSESIIPNLSISPIVLKGDRHHDGTLAIDLENENISGLKVAAFSAKGVKDGNDEFLAIWDSKSLDPTQYWKCIPSKIIEGKNRLTIEPDKFYILRSKERIALPKGVAVYCQAMDETLGEMRIHYAGFAHPFFGINRDDGKKGTPLIFEVRGHNVKVNLTGGEKLAQLVFYRMSEDCSGESEKEYNNQELKLSKLFQAWPDKLSRNDKDYTVTTALEK